MQRALKLSDACCCEQEEVLRAQVKALSADKAALAETLAQINAAVRLVSELNRFVFRSLVWLFARC